MLNCSWFHSFVSDPVKRNHILDQFSMITRPYTRLNGLKTIPFPAGHTRIANIWEYPPPPPRSVHKRDELACRTCMYATRRRIQVSVTVFGCFFKKNEKSGFWIETLLWTYMYISICVQGVNKIRKFVWLKFHFLRIQVSVTVFGCGADRSVILNLPVYKD